MSTLLRGAALLLLLAAACSDAPPKAALLADAETATGCVGIAPTSLDNVYPALLAANVPTGCSTSGCHGSGAGGLAFRNAHELWQASVGKPSLADPATLLVRPGDIQHSYLYLRLLPAALSQQPEGGPYLSDAQRASVAGWICAGAPEPALTSTDGGVDAGPTGPALTQFQPTSGVVGTQVTIDGAGFSADSAADSVSFNGAAATVLSAAVAQLIVAVPTSATTGKIAVAVGGLTAVSATDFQVIVPNPVPALSSISPGSTLAGASSDLALAVSGSNFVALSTVQFDGAALVTTFQSASALNATVPAASLALAGSHTITVVNPGPGGGTSGGKALAVNNPVPGALTLSPLLVVAGSTGVTLTVDGSGFILASYLTLNGAALTSSFVSASRLTAALPGSATSAVGTFSVVVTNGAPGGGSSPPATLTVGNPVPAVSAISPTGVAAGSGPASILVTGGNFLSTSQVFLDGTTQLSVAFTDASHLTATADATITASGGSHLLTVVNPTPGGGPSTPGVSFTVTNPAPTLSSITPSSVATGGATFTLDAAGTGFVPTSTVTFNGASVPTTFVSATALQAQIGTISTPGSYPVTVVSGSPGGGTSGSQTLTAATSTVPTITGLSPAPGTASTAFTLTVTGSGYTSTGLNKSVVTLNGVALTTTFVSGSQLTAAVPSTAAGTYPVVVKNGTSASASTSYTLQAPNPVPTLGTLSPSAALTGGAGFTLTVDGSGLVAGAVVSFNGNARTTTFVSAAQVTAAIPGSDLTTAGNFPVTATNPAPGGGTSSALTFTVQNANPVPSIGSTSPSPIATGSGAVTLAVTGTGFISTSAAALDGSARTTTFVGATSIQVALLATDTQTAGTHTLTVTNPAPGGGTSTGYTVSVVNQNPVPTLSTLSPTSTLAGSAGFTLTANGGSFVSGAAVIFNGVARTTTFVSAAQLTAPIASADVAVGGFLPVQVSNPTPGGGLSGTVSFEVDNPTPALTSITPATVVMGSGAFSLGVNGSGFVSGATVMLDGSSRTTHYVNSTQLSADIPGTDDAATGTHTITVVNPAPTGTGGALSNGLTLTVSSAPNPVPLLSSLSPCGAVAGGASFTLTLNGSSFVSGATATFNGTAVPVTFVSAGQLTASVASSLVTSAPSNDAIPVVVTNPAPGGGASGTVYFGLASQVVTLSGTVQPNIFTPSCATGSCHVTGGSAPMSLESGKAYADTVGVLSTGCPTTFRVQVCGPLRSQSVMVDKILATSTSPACFGNPMPKGSPLSSAQKRQIVDWIAQGAPQ